jgi:hypothetical protein
MSPSLEDALYARYPSIFAKWFLPPGQAEMARGIECDDGWFPLIDTLCEALQWETDHDDAPQIVALQIKEKFGSLRFHAVRGSDAQVGMIRLAARMSERICEVCGAPSTPMRTDRARIASRCEQH